MTTIQDNFLPPEYFSLLQEHCESTAFQHIKLGEKEFSYMQTPPEFLEFLQIPGHEIVLTFIRRAYPGFDSELRIHADNIIDGHKTSLASVLYINNPEGVTRNGTAFWEHHYYGSRLPDNVTPEEFDRLLTEDSNDISKWEQTDFILAKPNRLLTYDSQCFHSKYPQEIAKGERRVLVAFYKKSVNP